MPGDVNVGVAVGEDEWVAETGNGDVADGGRREKDAEGNPLPRPTSDVPLPLPAEFPSPFALAASGALEGT